MTQLTNECQLVVNYILKKTNEYNLNKDYSKQISLTIKRIQKLLYLIQIEYIKHTGTNMFEEDFYAWPIGPAIPEVYDFYIEYTTGASSIIKSPIGSLSKDKHNVIDIILENTNDINTYELIEHSRTLDNIWINAYNPDDEKHNQLISKKQLINCYSKKTNNIKTKKLKK